MNFFSVSSYFIVFSVIFTGFIWGIENIYDIKNDRYADIDKTTWICGDWFLVNSKGTTYENWKKLNDSTLFAESFFVSGKDTTILEKITIEIRLGKLYYIPIVNNQNNQQAVYFTNTFLNNSTMVFSNPTHDFPQEIKYEKIGVDSIKASISGLYNGNYKIISFPYSRKR